METMTLIDSIIRFLLFSSTLLLILGIVGTFLLRVLKIEGSPKLWICTLIVIMPLVYPIQAFFPDPIKVSLPSITYKTFDFQSSEAATGLQSVSSGMSVTPSDRISPNRIVEKETRPIESKISDTHGATRTEETALLFTVNWKLVATLAWIFIVTFLLTRLVTMIYNTNRFLNHAKPVTTPHVLKLMRQCAAETGLRRIPRLLTVDRIPAPMVMGFFKPGILLPKHLLHPEHREGLRFSLLHELKHVQRHHNWWLLLESLIGVAYFFHPVIYWAKKKIHEELEHICDNHVVHITNKSVSYADFLLHEIWQRNRERNPVLSLPFISGSKKTTRRVRSILEGTNQTMFARIRGRFAVGLMVLSFASLFLTSVAPSAKESEQMPHRIYPVTADSHEESAVQTDTIDLATKAPTELTPKERLIDEASLKGPSEEPPSVANDRTPSLEAAADAPYESYEEMIEIVSPEEPMPEIESTPMDMADARVPAENSSETQSPSDSAQPENKPVLSVDTKDNLVIAQKQNTADVDAGSTSEPKTKTEKYLGAPENWLLLYQIKETRILDDQTILFIMYGGDLYLNRLMARVPGLYIANGFSYKTFSSDKITKFDRIQALSPGSFSGSTGILGKFFPFQYDGKRTEAIKLLKKGLLDELVAEGAFPEAFPKNG